MNTLLFSNTPSVSVFDNRRLKICDIAYHRHPDSLDVTSEYITRHEFDRRGFLVRSVDPRMHDAELANIFYVTDLTGGILCAQSVDNGTTVALNDAAGRQSIELSNIQPNNDGTQNSSKAVLRTRQYEDSTLPGRPLYITEQLEGETARIIERFVYGINGVAEKIHNLAGQCVCHYDTAGLVQLESTALTGVPLSITRYVLKDAETPDVVVDWQGEDARAWNDQLGTEAHNTRSSVDSTGTVLATADAKGNVRRMKYNVAGHLSATRLTLKGGEEKVILKSMTYSAAGQKLREEHGNGVVTSYAYESDTQRLNVIRTERPAGHASGAMVIQDLRYKYDPVGNVITIRNDAEVTRFWRNQKVVPVNTYVYDSLYQLVSATGREMTSATLPHTATRTPVLTLTADSDTITNYKRTYCYDNAGNLTLMRHNAQVANNSYTTRMTISDKSNRGVLSSLTENKADVDALFTPGGQQKHLQPGQNLFWTPRNELQMVTPVVRNGLDHDCESYRYDAGSMRILKSSVQKTNTSILTKRAMYLPALELRCTKIGESEIENLQVITVGDPGRAQVRVLHWETGKPTGISNDQVRYSYDSLTGNCSLELDDKGNVISAEEYYPFGGTAVWTSRNSVEADYKSIRYSGKERDATGLYYFGYRYYQPWACRWLSTDPAGTVDGLNLFRMVQNNPVSMRDEDGLMPFLSCLGDSNEGQEGRKYVYMPIPHENRIMRLAELNVNRSENKKEDYIMVVGNTLHSDATMTAINIYKESQHGKDKVDLRGDILTSIWDNRVNNLENNANDVLYINSHGNPGAGMFFPDSSNDSSVSAEKVAEILVNEIKIPKNMRIRVSACHSAEGGEIAVSMPLCVDEPFKIYKHIVSNRGDFTKSLAGQLEYELIKLQPGRKKGLVAGYLGTTTLFPNKVNKWEFTKRNAMSKVDKHALSHFKTSSYAHTDFNGEIISGNISLRKMRTRTNFKGLESAAKRH